MKTHIEFAHLRLVAWRKLSVFENIIETNDNPQQGKKSFKPTRCAIRIFFGVTNPDKKSNQKH